MKKNGVMLTITICGIDSKERSKIFRLVSEAAVVGSQVTYKTGDTIECKLPTSKSQEIPDGFFDLVSTHEGSSLKVEDVSEESVADDTEVDSANLTKETQQYVDSATKEDDSNEGKEKQKEDNGEFSENSDNISESSANQETQQADVKKRGKVVLADDFCDKEIEDVFEMVKSKQQSLNPKSIEDSVLLLNELTYGLAQLLNITDSQKKETFVKLMNLAVKCERNNPGKPVTTRAMKKEKSDVSSEEWTKASNWLGERVRRHNLTLSTFFEYLFRCVRKYGILLIDKDFASEKEQKTSSEETNDVSLQQTTVTSILLESNKDEFMSNYTSIINSPELDESQVVKKVLALFGVEKPEAIRFIWQALKHETLVDLQDIANEALISDDDYSNVSVYIYECLKNSKFVDDNVGVVEFLNYLTILFDYRRD